MFTPGPTFPFRLKAVCLTALLSSPALPGAPPQPAGPPSPSTCAPTKAISWSPHPLRLPLGGVRARDAAVAFHPQEGGAPAFRLVPSPAAGAAEATPALVNLALGGCKF